ncbi:MAG: thermonuclease family protein [Magnetovibrio sp.]|nr:thermonuclease family protein [Magnetovibrio sp.]
MRNIHKLIAIIFVAILWTSPASADAVISGPGCIVDGNTLQIGGKVKNQKCWGGIDVRLHGSIAPSLGEVCTDMRKKEWNCGQKAKDALAQMIKHHSISCYHIDGEFANTLPVVTCISGRYDLAQEMVKMGMSKALHDQTNRYALEEKDAKQSRRGLWR